MNSLITLESTSSASINTVTSTEPNDIMFALARKLIDHLPLVAKSAYLEEHSDAKCASENEINQYLSESVNAQKFIDWLIANNYIEHSELNENLQIYTIHHVDIPPTNINYINYIVNIDPVKTKTTTHKIIVMNGKGGVGKDALCDGAKQAFKTANVSSIDPIKAIAKQNGWNGEKDLKSRKFLADLKQIFTDYNNLPTKFLVNKTNEFMKSDNEVLFVHIREPEQIDAFKKAIAPLPCYAVLVRRKAIDDNGAYGNTADDNVNEYNYDVVFHNDAPLEESIAKFNKILKNI